MGAIRERRSEVVNIWALSMALARIDNTAPGRPTFPAVGHPERQAARSIVSQPVSL